MKLIFFSLTAFLFISLTGCSHLPGSHPVVHIGDTVNNGIVFYVDDSRQHGIICSFGDYAYAAWDTSLFDAQHYELYNPPFVSGTDTVLGAGYASTTAIVNQIGDGFYAANICRFPVTDGFGMWSLPSKEELNLMYINLKKAGLGHFVDINPNCPECGVFYWSSSEISNLAAWSQRFDNGEQVNYAWKNNLFFVRGIRAF